MENTQNTGISARKYGVLAAPRQEGYCQYQYVVYLLHLYVLYLGAFLPVLRTGRFNFKLAPKARHSTRFGKSILLNYRLVLMGNINRSCPISYRRFK